MNKQEYFEKCKWIKLNPASFPNEISKRLNCIPHYLKESPYNNVFLRDCIGVWRLYAICSDKSILQFKIHVSTKTYDEIEMEAEILSVTAFLVTSDDKWKEHCYPGVYRVKNNQL